MKKQLLLAMTAMTAMTATAFGAAPDLSANATNLTTVFSNTQTGALQVKGRVSSVAPTAKYVVFSTPDGKQMDSVLNLRPYIMSSTGNSGFQGTNDYVKVQKVVGRVGQDLKTERVTFVVRNYDIPNPFLATLNIEEGKMVTAYPYQLLKKTDLDAIAKEVTAANPTGKKNKYEAKDTGEISRDDGATYSPSGTIAFKQEGKGILKVINGGKYTPANMIKSETELKAFDAAFAKERDLGNTWVLVTVK